MDGATARNTANATRPRISEAPIIVAMLLGTDIAVSSPSLRHDDCFVAYFLYGTLSKSKYRRANTLILVVGRADLEKSSENNALPQGAGELSTSDNKRLFPAPPAPRGGKASRDKGNRLERAIVRLLQAHSLDAERVPLSGAAGGSYLGDLTVPVLGRDICIEAKARASGFSQLYAWLENRDVLVVKADRRDALVILPLRLAAQIAAATVHGMPSPID
ncbi:hypothetical protein QEV83_07855 [Methylocapsa sp. D3K7]|uniref:hypothetical protein n=1 Tax=Methylocapsa sp. D3K7 TaxID=3041435 RepID=UPI00244E6886|nr:hypothetical protein [Methylocapsa sp. D3K7]WGJ16146.1 hypothetical protein QEV83_07855 [Methylocapsa sp. D3K7]